MAFAGAKSATSLGKKGAYKYIYAACVDCGKERWVALKGGMPRSSRCYSCSNKTGRENSQEKNGRWAGGRHEEVDGYVMLSLPKDSPYRCMVDKQGRVREHRIVVAKHIGRPLKTWEIVHHINGNRTDNRIENLELLPGEEIHCSITRMQQRIKELEQEVNSYKEVYGELC